MATPTSSNGATQDNVHSTRSAWGVIMALPQPGTPGTPFFRGKSISEFLLRYEEICFDYHVGTSEMIRRS